VSVLAALIFLGAVLSGRLTVVLAIGPMFVLDVGAGIASPAALTQAISVKPTRHRLGLGPLWLLADGRGCDLHSAGRPRQRPGADRGAILVAAGVIGQASFWIALPAGCLNAYCRQSLPTPSIWRRAAFQ
jgi:DHA1 family bicyclomycin/chloramphenicol resistance-like MFS transporter